MVKSAMEVSMDWLQTAVLASKGGMYEQALYSLEMAVEIAFKAVLISMNVEVPKSHDIRKTARAYLSDNNKLPKAFTESLNGYLLTFNTLLDYRTTAGYGFEPGFLKDDFATQANKLIPECTEIVAACDKVIKAVNKRG